SENRTILSRGMKFSLWAMAWLAWSGLSPLHAQPPYSTASGRSTTYSFYDPLQVPAPKAPNGASLAPFLSGHLPTVSPSEAAINKAATAPYAQSSFTSPPQIQIFPSVIPRAPGAPVAPIVQTPTVGFQGIQEAPPQLQPPSPDVAVGPSDVVMVVNSVIAQF